MAFGLNRVELIGRLGADVTVNQLMSGGRVANLSIATDESYITGLVFHDAPCCVCGDLPGNRAIVPSPFAAYGAAEVTPHRSISSDTGSGVRPELE